jgi:hypothetical protein
MKRVLLALGGACLVVLSGCGSHPPAPASSPTTGPLPASTTTTTAAANTTTTTVPNTSVIPEKITVTYVNAVFAKLDQVYGDAVRSVVAAHRLTPQAAEDLAAIYTKRLDARELADFAQVLSLGLKNIRKPPGNMITRVADLISTERSCIFARATENYNAVTIHPVRNSLVEWIGLRPTRSPAYASTNPTPWVEFFELEVAPSYRMPNECGS